jgi:hypothetical protein
MKEATSLKADGEAAASLLRSRFFAEGFRLNVPATGPSTRYLWDRFRKHLLRPLADQTETALGANGFISDKLMAANWACIWNIKDLVGIHFELTPGIWSIIGNS